MQFFETHCHLYHHYFDSDREETLARARAAGVTEFLIIGYNRESSRKALALTNPDEGMYAAVGFHPHDAAEWNTAAEGELRRWLKEPGVLAIGEIGLDFFRDVCPRDVQEVALRAQLELAAELELPYVVHTRESVSASLEIIAPYAERGYSGIMHCWSGTVEEARWARSVNLLLGVGGVLTYKNPGPLPEVVVAAGLEGLVLETDCPYLPPVPYRGKRNEPAYIPLIAAKLAEVSGSPIEIVAETTRRNGRRLLGLETAKQAA